MIDCGNVIVSLSRDTLQLPKGQHFLLSLCSSIDEDYLASFFALVRRFEDNNYPKMTLEETMVSQELANVDLSKVAALQQKRTLAFVNHFVLTNVQFLNNFMKRCEQKLMDFDRKLEKVNAAMVLLEARLSSIPELNTTTVTQAEKPSEPIEASPKPSEEPPASAELAKETTEQEAPSPAVDTVEGKPQSHPEYDRFVKMVQVGVPLQAVKLKLQLEGLDHNVLDEILGK